MMTMTGRNACIGDLQRPGLELLLRRRLEAIEG
ncbi:hypothetical protein E9229_003282 [Paeniglutamicibacter cryotolerans]|uniref:Uncharacterized protein n=1 Tax=Paeniglutamicibacter cryotolerans TaxID=670079 RepID=A0A839QQV4_9MICC|nr:hypothetical protein [Paeniglutamicibacter cryotolerans]